MYIHMFEVYFLMSSFKNDVPKKIIDFAKDNHEDKRITLVQQSLFVVHIACAYNYDVPVHVVGTFSKCDNRNLYLNVRTWGRCVIAEVSKCGILQYCAVSLNLAEIQAIYYYVSWSLVITNLQRPNRYVQFAHSCGQNYQ